MLTIILLINNCTGFIYQKVFHFKNVVDGSVSSLHFFSAMKHVMLPERGVC